MIISNKSSDIYLLGNIVGISMLTLIMSFSCTTHKCIRLCARLSGQCPCSIGYQLNTCTCMFDFKKSLRINTHAYCVFVCVCVSSVVRLCVYVKCCCASAYMYVNGCVCVYVRVCTYVSVQLSVGFTMTTYTQNVTSRRIISDTGIT